MERINEIWNQIESGSATVAGIFRQRYSETSECDAYLGLKYPENYRMLILRMPFSVGKAFNLNYEFKGLKFEKAYDSHDSDFILLNLVLVNNDFKDVFNSLVADVLSNILDETGTDRILNKYTDQLFKWQNLFERFNKPGLSPEEQRGLFGELYFLRKFLLNNEDLHGIVESWIGCEKQVRDFQSGSWSVEVKTSSGNNHQKVHISSERQLDTSNVKNLFLYHLSLEPKQNSGETLNDIVNSISEILQPDAFALKTYQGKLLEGGYFEHHKSLYDMVGYVIRHEQFYEVKNEFPRIEEKYIRDGVGDVKYTIIISQCAEFTVNERYIFQTIKSL